jgi:molybdate transport system substrate-binding protein
MSRTWGRIAAVAAFIAAQATFATAAEVKVFSTIGVQAALEELVPNFEKASGHKLNITWATAAVLVKRLQAGETADLLVLTKQGLDTMVKENKATAGADAVFASSGMAMVVKKGAPKPDISTAEAFKHALLKAKTISYSNPEHGGASGVYLAKPIERMGIADQLKAKTHYPPPSGNAGNLVVSGEAELAVQQEPEVMSVAGVDMVGPLPADVEQHHYLRRRSRRQHHTGRGGQRADQVPAYAGSRRCFQGSRLEAGGGEGNVTIAVIPGRAVRREPGIQISSSVCGSGFRIAAAAASGMTVPY